MFGVSVVDDWAYRVVDLSARTIRKNGHAVAVKKSGVVVGGIDGGCRIVGNNGGLVDVVMALFSH